MLEKKQSLAKLASEVEIYPQVLKNVRVKDKIAAQEDEAVQAEVKKVTEALGSDGQMCIRDRGGMVRGLVVTDPDDHCFAAGGTAAAGKQSGR